MGRSIGIAAVMTAAGLALLGACGGEAPAPVAEVVSAEAAPPEPVRLPIGEITPADVPALMAAVYPDGVPAGVADIGVFVLGERVGLMTGADNAEACADCTGSFSLFYLVRTDAGFLMQRDYRDFHQSGRGGKYNRGAKVLNLGGVDGGPAFAGYADVNNKDGAGCTAQELTVGIFTEAGPRVALKAPFGYRKGAARVAASLIESEPFQADFAIEYSSPQNDFVAPYLFVNQALRASFPIPEWTQAVC